MTICNKEGKKGAGAGGMEEERKEQKKKDEEPGERKGKCERKDGEGRIGGRKGKEGGKEE